jgi:hypothetical protein
MMHLSVLSHEPLIALSAQELPLLELVTPFVGAASHVPSPVLFGPARPCTPQSTPYKPKESGGSPCAITMGLGGLHIGQDISANTKATGLTATSVCPEVTYTPCNCQSQRQPLGVSHRASFQPVLDRMSARASICERVGFIGCSSCRNTGCQQHTQHCQFFGCLASWG